MYLFIFFIIYFLFVFVIRSFLLWKKTGINPLTFSKTDDAHGYNGKIYKAISFIELIIVGIYALKNEWYDYLLPFWYFEYPLLQKIGWGLLILSLILVWIAQNQMGKSWRIGIDEKNKTKLVTSGIFGISRNPIFMGIIIANIGLFLVIPNAFTMLVLSISIISINTQVRLEEKFLEKEFRDDFIHYRNKVRRWL